jgi:type VI secretion system secreted protein VgrG
MGAKSGKAVKAVTPAQPEAADDADVADPGEVAKAKAEQVEQEAGKYGEAPKKAHKEPETEEEEEKKTAWIEIELIDEADEPVPSEKYEITLPDGSVAKGTLDGDGFARVDGIEPGSCEIAFPDLDKDAWEKA